jgi:queuine/archaeosine tRNA-ribosyltransferase
MPIARPKEIDLGKVKLPIPIFFPSVSTVKTALPPVEYLTTLQYLRSLKNQFLVSAFDLYHSDEGEKLAQCLITAQQAGVTVLMDSGNYESYWKNEKDYWNPSRFHDVLRRFTCSFAFSFDEQNPPKEEDAHVKLILECWHQDQSAAGERQIVPIVHGSTEALPNLCARIALETKVPMIAVAERRLGDGVFERTKSVRALREKLNDTGRYVGLHLLGTGNPISIALYTWAGSDSFDGLEWCQTAVDHDTGQLFHLSQSDFFRKQTEWGMKTFRFIRAPWRTI